MIITIVEFIDQLIDYPIDCASLSILGRLEVPRQGTSTSNVYCTHNIRFYRKIRIQELSSDTLYHLVLCLFEAMGRMMAYLLIAIGPVLVEL